MFLRRIWTMLVLAIWVLGSGMTVACAQESAGAAAAAPGPLLTTDAQAYRWQAMADGYERLGMLNVDSDAAADAKAYRWQAMARGYEQLGLLNVDSDAAADAMAYRWQAMARYYADHGWLNE